MTTVTFDTLAATKRLREAGLDQKTAEAIVTEIATAQVELFTFTVAQVALKLLRVGG